MTTVLDSPSIGIDLGTTYSCVGVFRCGQVEIIENDHGNRTTPSCVSFDENQRFIGEAAKNMMEVNPYNSVYDSKRLIGRRFDDHFVQHDLQSLPFTIIEDRGKPKIRLDYKRETKSFLPEEISAMVLFKMKETAEAHLGMPVSKAVITVPAYFNYSQRRATMDAGIIAGFKCLRIMNEPTAAALAYGYRLKDGKNRTILIFDLGGGTCDVSILSIKNGEFRVLSTAGDSHLGGEDFNSCLVKHFIKEFKKKHNKDVSNDKQALISLRTACERAKLCLSSTTQATVAIESFYEGIDFTSSISRSRFEELNVDLFRATIDLVEKAIRDANLAKTGIDEVVLVGGSTRIPKIRKLLQDFFNGKELSKTINPDEAVAQGATIQAAMLNGDTSGAIRGLVIQDVTTFNIGYFSAHDITQRKRVISRNIAIPTKGKLRLKNSREFSKDIVLSVYERYHQEPNTLGRFVLHGVPPSPRGPTNVDVTFSILHDGILNVAAVENSSGTWKSIAVTIVNNWLTKAEWERMIEDAERFRLDDLVQRNRATARNDLELYCYNLKSEIERVGIVHQSSKEALLEMIEQTIQWLENDLYLATVEEMKSRKQNIEHIVNIKPGSTIPSPKINPKSFQ